MTRRADWEGIPEDVWLKRLAVATLEFHTEVDSTNTRGRALAADGSTALPALVVADRQTAGSGRMGRSWISDSDQGLWGTVVLEAGHGVDVLPLLAGLAICRAAEAASGRSDLGLGIKWPNDVVCPDGKLAGVLCVRVGDRVLVGVGINVNHDVDDLPQGPGIRAASLRSVRGRPVDRGALLVGLVRELSALWPSSVSAEGKPGISSTTLAQINARSILRGSALAAKGTVRHSSGAVESMEEMEGRGGEILADGGLQLLFPTGDQGVLLAGSVRALP